MTPRIVLEAHRMAQLDRETIHTIGVPGIVLMERAAVACATAAIRLAPEGDVLVLAGPGNNGGDGLAIARILTSWGRTARVVLLGRPEDLPADAATNLATCRTLGIPVLSTDHPALAEDLERARLIVDALFGIGMRDRLPETAAHLLRAAKRASSARVLAIDLPSGMIADTGTCDPDTLPAHTTVTLGAWKWAHLTGPERQRCGEVQAVDIGIPTSVVDGLAPAPAIRWDLETARARFRPLPADAHKGLAGRVHLRVGSEAMPGAAALAAAAAVRAGAGLVHVHTPPGVARLVLNRTPECLISPPTDPVHAELLGCGRGTGPDAQAELDAVSETDGPPLVLDADALTLLARRDGAPPRRPTVLTPHPGELARLAGCSVQEVLHDHVRHAVAAATRYGAIVVAKGAGAIVAGPAGPLAFIPPGSPGMASAGTGDVLAGILTALLARYPLEDAACLGTWLHARAGAAAARRVGHTSLRASDLLDGLSEALGELE